MTDPTPLEQLAAIAGIQPTYSDAWGEEHPVADATRVALLGAMRIAADNADAIGESLRRLRDVPWRTPLAPVAVLRGGEGADPGVVLTLPVEAPAGSIAWRLTSPEGGERGGTIRIADLPVTLAHHVDGRRHERRRLRLPALRPGEYRFAMETGGGEDVQTLIVAPPRCHLPPPPRSGRHWALAVQLYGQRSARDWGHGDFSQLADMLDIGARLGAAGVGINPVHAMFPERPAHRSPYSPSDRRFLAVLYIDVEAVPDFLDCEPARARVASPAFRDALAHARGAALVDYAAAAALKLPLLELLFQCFRDRHLANPASERAVAFRRFRADGGEALDRLATFQALSEHHPGVPWTAWPAPLRDPAGPDVAEFAACEASRIAFFAWLQWEGERQLAMAAAVGRKHAMTVGVYRDLAVGPAADGAETWSNRALMARDVSVGAPPDAWNALGQDWGLPPYVPEALRAAAYQPFREIVRANMRHAGALRIDHAMGLERMFWIPAGGRPSDGAYVRYPVDDLCGLVALESAAARCLVIGEDLGTVPPGFTERMQSWGMLSYRLLYFERDSAGLVPPAWQWRREAAVAVTTHDLATLSGYWAGHDLELRAALGLYPTAAMAAAALGTRRRDKEALLAALRADGLLADGERDPAAPMDADLAVRIYRFLARTPARLLLVNLEDLFGELEQHNVPGTIDEYPNWRRRSARTVESLARDPLLALLAEAIAKGAPAGSARRE